VGPTQLPIHWVQGDVSPGAKWQRHESDRSPACSAEIKNGEAAHPLSHTYVVLN
jgi:hypothetical protein